MFSFNSHSLTPKRSFAFFLIKQQDFEATSWKKIFFGMEFNTRHQMFNQNNYNASDFQMKILQPIIIGSNFFISCKGLVLTEFQNLFFFHEAPSLTTVSNVHVRCLGRIDKSMRLSQLNSSKPFFRETLIFDFVVDSKVFSIWTWFIQKPESTSEIFDSEIGKSFLSIVFDYFLKKIMSERNDNFIFQLTKAKTSKFAMETG